MFAERLSVAQVKDFLNEIYPKKQGFHYSIEKSVCIYVNVHNDKNNFDMNIRLEDYGVTISDETTISWPHKWLKYLYKVFGEEYKQAYIQECLSVFDED